jgi:hypothetical protein
LDWFINYSCHEVTKKADASDSHWKSDTSAYFLTSLPAQPGCPSFNHPTSVYSITRRRNTSGPENVCFGLEQVSKKRRGNTLRNESEIAFFNCLLEDLTLVPRTRKPFDVRAEGLISEKSRGEPLCSFVNEIIGLPLALTVFPQVYGFLGDAVLELVEPGLCKKGWRTNRGTA